MTEAESRCDACGNPTPLRKKCSACGAYKFDMDPVEGPAAQPWTPVPVVEPRAVAQQVWAPPAGPELELVRPPVERAPLVARRVEAVGVPVTEDVSVRTARFRAANAASTRAAWWYVRAPVLLILLGFSAAYWGGKEWTFLDGVNLAFHEFGHIAFSWGGQMLHFMGGTLFEMLLPLGFTIYFALKRQGFSAGVTLWWLFQTMPHTGRYMIDSELQLLPLLGGGEHDWVYLFGRWGVMEHNVAIGITVRSIGNIGMGVCLVGLLLWLIFAPREVVEQDQLEGV